MSELLFSLFMLKWCTTTAAHSVQEDLILERGVLHKVLNIVVANAAAGEMTEQSNLNSWHFIPVLCIIWNIMVFWEISKALQNYFFIITFRLADSVALTLLYRVHDIYLMNGVGILLRGS